ncbi:MAG: glycosyltransferase family 2 protein [Crocinitomicaceae bacterium]|nr:glycosyltransferase family 2 protein [Crocinitomicaceae bacterium]
MDKLSVVIITLNEERNIARAIDSVLKVADEIIVVDSYSEDRTKEICEHKGVRFIQRKWEGYAQTKNYANDQAENEWIFSLDADEALDEKMQMAVLKLKQEGFKGVYLVNRLTNYCGKWIKHSTWYPDWKIRIFPKSKTKWVGEYVHEELEFSEEMEEFKLEGHLHHYSYYSYKEHRKRADKYSILTAKKLHQAGRKVGPLRPVISQIGRFITMFFLKLGFLDGWEGFKIAQISAQSNKVKYKELRRLNKEDDQSRS